MEWLTLSNALLKFIYIYTACTPKFAANPSKLKFTLERKFVIVGHWPGRPKEIFIKKANNKLKTKLIVAATQRKSAQKCLIWIYACLKIKQAK